MRVLVTGVGGQLGHDCVNELAARGVKLPETLDMERMADEVCQYVLKKLYFWG